MVVSEADIREAAMVICQERCAFMGEPACWRHKDDQGEPLPWPAPACNEPGCLVLAEVALRVFADKAATPGIPVLEPITVAVRKLNPDAWR